MLNQLAHVARAALFAVIAIGGMATGLSVTTYTLSKANDLLLGSAEAEPLAETRGKHMCLK